MQTYSYEELKARFKHREKLYSHTISGQRRHELLFEPYGITPTEYRILSFLYFSETEAEPSVIADTLNILRQTMTKVIDSLERKNLVVRTAHPSDRRRIFVQLLPAGQEMAERLLDIETDYNQKVEDHFTPEEHELYLKLFSKMNTAREQVLLSILEARKESK